MELHEDTINKVDVLTKEEWKDVLYSWPQEERDYFYYKITTSKLLNG